MDEPVRFDDSAAYEQFMGRWSRLASDAFLSWLAPAAGQRWLDVGCGNGAFSERIVQRCALSELHGIDPSAEQVAYAQDRLTASRAHFRGGDAMALPFADAEFDLAVMGLVIFFVPDPAQAVAEMRRVVRPGGVVASYAWDMLGGGFPANPVFIQMRALGLTPPMPPSANAAGLEESRELWAAAGLQEIATHEITVERTFADYEDFWATCLLGPGLGRSIKALEPSQITALKTGVRNLLTTNTDGSLTCTARANAIKRRVPDTDRKERET